MENANQNHLLKRRPIKRAAVDGRDSAARFAVKHFLLPNRIDARLQANGPYYNIA
jgi:hypothetical protein